VTGGIPRRLVGTWSATREVAVRTSAVPFRSVKSPVTIVVTIREDRSVDGWMGKAKFEGWARNRGMVGKTLDLFSDFVIAGRLTRSIFPDDTLTVNEISMPFDVEENAITGTIFQKESLDIFPMVNVQMTRQ